MSHPQYHRWPRPGQYVETPEILSYWPRLQGTMYCIAPAINVTWVNTEDNTNPLGTYTWGSRLRVNEGTLWDYGSFDFPGQPDYRLFIENIQLLDTFRFWKWLVNVRVIRGSALETAFGSGGYTFWPVTRFPEPWAQEIEIDVKRAYGVQPIISLWCRPSTLEDMQPNSYDPLS